MTEKATQVDWVERARAVLPAGGYGNFDPNIVIREGRGARVWGENGVEYIDYLIGSGPLILGHAHPEVVEVVEEQLRRGTTFFANNSRGIELAEEICSAVTCAQQVRYVSTGSEANMYALRLARARTGRDKILKFEGGFHGMSAEGLMSLAPTRLQNFPLAHPDSAGIPDSVRDQVLVAPFNDSSAVREIVAEYSEDIAAVIVEPLQRLLPPKPGFLETLRELTNRYGIVLIFDEVVTGFRLAYGGAQERYGVIPDLCTLGKIIGGGFALAAIAGKTEIMGHFDKEKSGDDEFTFQNGTLSGNPVAAVAGLKTLEILRRPGSYERIRKNGKTVIEGINKHLRNTGVPHRILGDPVMFDVVFTRDDVHDYRGVLGCDAKRSKQFNSYLRKNSVLKSDTKFYVSMVLTEEDLDCTLNAVSQAASHVVDA